MKFKEPGQGNRKVNASSGAVRTSVVQSVQSKSWLKEQAVPDLRTTGWDLTTGQAARVCSEPPVAGPTTGDVGTGRSIAPGDPVHLFLGFASSIGRIFRYPMKSLSFDRTGIFQSAEQAQMMKSLLDP